MQTSGLIILGTTIAIVAITSEGQILKGDGNGVCNVTTTQKRYGWEDYVSWTERKCCEGYEQKLDNCVPLCSPECKNNSHCAKPNECRCDSGWSGENCDSPDWCFVRVNSTSTNTTISSKLPDAIPTEDALRRETEWKRFECRPECRDHVPNFAVSGSTIHYLYIESPCNMKADSQNILVTYKYEIIGIVGIGSLIIIVVCIMTLCLVRKKTKRNEESTNLEFDSVDACNVQQLPEEPTQPEYDNVASFQHFPEELTEPEKNYVNVCIARQYPNEPMEPDEDYVNVCTVRQFPKDQPAQPENEYVNVCNVQKFPEERTQSEYDYVDVGNVWQLP